MIRCQDRVESSLPRCVCGWKNCRDYQKAWREKNVDAYNGVVKLEFRNDRPDSLELKASIDRTLGVPESKRNMWKHNATNDVFVSKYTIARHHYTKAYLRKMDETPNFGFFKLLSIQGARKYLFSVDPQESLTVDGQMCFLQTPNVSEEHVEAEFDSVMKEDENRMLREQLHEMSSHLTLVHEMVQKLQENIFDNRTVQTGRSSGMPSLQRSSSVTSFRSKSTIVSTSKSVKSLPREIELENDEEEDAESLEAEAFENRSIADRVSVSYHGSKTPLSGVRPPRPPSRPSRLRPPASADRLNS